MGGSQNAMGCEVRADNEDVVGILNSTASKTTPGLGRTAESIG